MNDFISTPTIDTLDSELDLNAVVTETATPEVATEAPIVDASKDLQSALAQKEHFRQKAEKAEQERKALEAKLSQNAQATLNVEDYIDISAALEGLDSREKMRLAEEHKLSGKTLKEIRESEDYQLWQSAYRAKQEKENALRPSGTQPTEDAPKSLASRLASASLEEKEKILRENNLYKEFRPRADRTKIGNIGNR